MNSETIPYQDAIPHRDAFQRGKRFNQEKHFLQQRLYYTKRRYPTTKNVILYDPRFNLTTIQGAIRNEHRLSPTPHSHSRNL